MQTSAYPPNIRLISYDAERLRIRAPITTAIKPSPTPSQVKDNPEDGRLVVGTGVAVAVGTTGIAVAYTAVGNAGSEVGSLVELGGATVTGVFVRVTVGVLVRVAVELTGVFVRVSVGVLVRVGVKVTGVLVGVVVGVFVWVPVGVAVDDTWGVGVKRSVACRKGSARSPTELLGGK